jgi:hypothetical protein
MKQQWQGTRPPTITNPKIKPDPTAWSNNIKEQKTKYKNNFSNYNKKRKFSLDCDVNKTAFT